MAAGVEQQTSGSTRLAHANRIVARERVHRREAHGLGRVLAENERLERRLVARGKTLVVLEHAIDLDLDAAILAVLDVRHDLEPAVGQDPRLQAGAGDGDLRGLVEEDEVLGVLEGVWGCIWRWARRL